MLLKQNQRQIISLLSKGHSYEAIAKSLCISVKLVEKRISELYVITGTNKAPALVNFAWENNILPIAEPQSKSYY